MASPIISSKIVQSNRIRDQSHFDAVIIGAGIAGVSTFHWFSKLSNKKVLLLDSLPLLYQSKISQSPNDLKSSINVSRNASIVAGCWVTPPLNETSSHDLTKLLSHCHPLALEFYDSFGLKGTKMDWKLYRKSSVPKEEWESKKITFEGASRIPATIPDSSSTIQCSGKEFRFFDNPALLLSHIISKTISDNPKLSYQSNCAVLKLERNQANPGTWAIHSSQTDSNSHQSSSVITCDDLVIATGSGFLEVDFGLKDLNYLQNSFHSSIGSVVDVKSRSGLKHHIHQSGMIFAPLSSQSEGQTGLARIGSTQRVHNGAEALGAIQKLISDCQRDFEDIPQDLELVEVKSGKRIYRKNRLPIVGQVVSPTRALELYPHIIHGKVLPKNNEAQVDGLYVICGMGSRGFSLAPQLANWLVSSTLTKDQDLSQVSDAGLRSIWKKLSPGQVLQDGFRRNAIQHQKTISSQK